MSGGIGGVVKTIMGTQDAPTVAGPDANLVSPLASYGKQFAAGMPGAQTAVDTALTQANQQGITNAGLQQGLASTFANQANANMQGAQNVGNQLQSFLSGGASGVFNDPVYQAMQAQGEQGVSRRFAAGGKGLSGNEMIGLSQANMGLANQFYNQQLGNLQSSMGALSNLGSAANNALGLGYNAQSNALSGVTQAYQNAANNQQQSFGNALNLTQAAAGQGQAQYNAQLGQTSANQAATQQNNAMGNMIAGSFFGGDNGFASKGGAWAGKSLFGA